MKTGIRKNAGASCRIRFSQAIAPSVRGRAREITHMHSHQRGYASQLLKSVCQEADQEGIKLIVTVEPFGEGLDLSSLVGWYERNGFQMIQRNPLVMMR